MYEKDNKKFYKNNVIIMTIYCQKKNNYLKLI